MRVLSRLVERLRGLRDADLQDACVVLVPCCDIHTFRMERPIDAAFVDASGVVEAVYRGIAPGSRVRYGQARMVIERIARSDSWFERGDELFCPPRP